MMETNFYSVLTMFQALPLSLAKPLPSPSMEENNLRKNILKYIINWQIIHHVSFGFLHVLHAKRPLLGSYPLRGKGYVANSLGR
jgi:hypothetical protein